ncbi:MAG: hypothetical protein J5J00_11300 [Deltaproteobacteria bacterium]|nr:hypothetical protein [Deltaproteobacteria bacterium]
MQSNIIDRLFFSFEELEQAIASAKDTLAKRDVIPNHIMKRLNSYDGILLKQRNLAQSLCEHINNCNWDEVSRHVNLINGLSALIRDDARAILAAISGRPEAPGEEDNIDFC